MTDPRTRPPLGPVLIDERETTEPLSFVVYVPSPARIPSNPSGRATQPKIIDSESSSPVS